MARRFDKSRVDPSTDTAVSPHAFTAGSLPSVCVITGRPATSLEPRFAQAPIDRSPFGIVLTVAGAVFGVVQMERVHGQVPYNASAARHEPSYVARRKRRASRGLLIGGAGVIAFVAAANGLLGEELGGFLLGMAGLLLTVIGLVYLGLASHRPIADIPLIYDVQSTGHVYIRNAHPHFVAALQQQAIPTRRAVPPRRSGTERPTP